MIAFEWDPKIHPITVTPLEFTTRVVVVFFLIWIDLKHILTGTGANMCTENKPYYVKVQCAKDADLDVFEWRNLCIIHENETKNTDILFDGGTQFLPNSFRNEKNCSVPRKSDYMDLYLINPSPIHWEHLFSLLRYVLSDGRKGKRPGCLCGDHWTGSASSH